MLVRTRNAVMCSPILPGMEEVGGIQKLKWFLLCALFSLKLRSFLIHLYLRKAIITIVPKPAGPESDDEEAPVQPEALLPQAGGHQRRHHHRGRHAIRRPSPPGLPYFFIKTKKIDLIWQPCPICSSAPSRQTM